MLGQRGKEGEEAFLVTMRRGRSSLPSSVLTELVKGGLKRHIAERKVALVDISWEYYRGILLRMKCAVFFVCFE